MRLPNTNLNPEACWNVYMTRTRWMVGSVEDVWLRMKENEASRNRSGLCVLLSNLKFDGGRILTSSTPPTSYY